MFRACISIQHSRHFSSRIRSLINVQPEVSAALKSNGPVVALESTIITHGMPFPQNLETALTVENIVRKEGAIPATIAIVNGCIKVGLSPPELESLARSVTNSEDRQSPDTSRPTVKTSRRDIAYVLSKGWNGGTTVAGTMIVSDLVGIKIFATGGIGGVHRHGQNTLDISADLLELGQSSVAVVSSGVKSILDIPRTLEYLETQGVCVSTFQCADHDFPAFYTIRSGYKAAYNFASASEAANAIAISNTLGLGSSILIAVPVPQEYAMDENVIKNAIDKALKSAEEQGITGKEATPFLLSAIAKITDGKSLATNIALIKNNARVAAQIAVELANPNLGESTQNSKRDTNVSNTTSNVPVVVGGSIIDTCYSVIEDDLELSNDAFGKE